MEKGPGDSTLTKPKCKLEGFWNSSLCSVTISTLVIALHACKHAAQDGGRNEGFPEESKLHPSEEQEQQIVDKNIKVVWKTIFYSVFDGVEFLPPELLRLISEAAADK